MSDSERLIGDQEIPFGRKSAKEHLYASTATLSAHTLHSSEVLESLGSSKKGLSTRALHENRDTAGGEHIIPSPVPPLPAWMCCIGGMGMGGADSREMDMYNQCIPEHTLVKREGRNFEKMPTEVRIIRIRMCLCVCLYVSIYGVPVSVYICLRLSRTHTNPLLPPAPPLPATCARRYRAN